MPDSILPFAARQTADGVASLVSNVTVGNSLTEAVMLSYAIPANSMVAGTTYDVAVSGYGGSTAVTLTLRLRYGGLAGIEMCANVITCGATTSPQGWWWDSTFTCRTVGATGTASGQGLFLNELGTTFQNAVKLSDKNPGTGVVIDTTTQKDLVLTAQWGTPAAVGATITATNGLISLAKA